MGKIILKTQTDDASIDEEKIMKLQPGSSITYFTNDSWSLWISFDQDLQKQLLQSYFSEKIKRAIRATKKRRAEEYVFGTPIKKYKTDN